MNKHVVASSHRDYTMPGSVRSTRTDKRRRQNDPFLSSEINRSTCCVLFMRLLSVSLCRDGHARTHALKVNLNIKRNFTCVFKFPANYVYAARNVQMLKVLRVEKRLKVINGKRRDAVSRRWGNSTRTNWI